MRIIKLVLLALLALNTAGCGTFVAHVISRSPNRYPSWFSAEAPVTLAFSPKLLTNFPAQYVEVGPPPAKLCYRVVPPADYHFSVTSSNWLDSGEKDYEFRFRATVPGATNRWTTAPRGTVFLLHGYGEAQFSMLPWALRLGEDGWECVLVDLRGHGKSTGKRVYFTVVETNDMIHLRDRLARDRELPGPVALIGESYGAVLALRWKTVDPRIGPVVAIAPYASLSNAVLNIRREYTPLVPAVMVRAGVKRLPHFLEIPAGEFDTTTVLERHPVQALFIAGGEDKIAPVPVVKQVYALASPGSQLIVVPEATHEALTYYFKELEPGVMEWLDGQSTDK
jgi:pimeloyl-ACP methyl ester carboxylesterase